MKRWITAAALLAALGLPALAQDAKEDATYRKIEAQLESTVVPVLSYEEVDIAEVVKDIAKKANVSIIVDKKALEGLDAGDRKITLELNQIKASNALNIVLDQVKLKKSYKNGVLYITTEAKADEDTTSKVYDVRDITVKITDFPAPRLKLKGEDESGSIVEFPQEKGEVDTDDIVELIEESVKADWGGKASVTIVKGNLIVRATRAVHKEVSSLLRQLRSAK
jgi:type II secretory pathway component GspD/PulD (secretin)